MSRTITMLHAPPASNRAPLTTCWTSIRSRVSHASDAATRWGVRASPSRSGLAQQLDLAPNEIAELVVRCQIHRFVWNSRPSSPSTKSSAPAQLAGSNPPDGGSTLTPPRGSHTLGLAGCIPPHAWFWRNLPCS
jgi:hypothetical protein